MKRSLKSTIIVAFALVFAFGVLFERTSVVAFGISQASAQQKKGRSLFSILFGRRKVKRKTVRRKLKRRQVRRGVKRRKLRSTKRSSSKRKSNRNVSRRVDGSVPKSAKSVLSGTTGLDSDEQTEKRQDARRVVVVGDFLAGGLSDGLTVAFRDNRLINVLDRSKGSSGFVRADIANWPERVLPTAEKDKPSYIVAMLGTNDRQLLRIDGKRYKKRTPEWDAEYKSRVTALGVALKQTGIPFVWVGLPPVRYKSMNTDFLVFNEWYRDAALASGGKFVDVWDGFSDAEGAYSRSGPDVNGQIVLLRAKDGINLTKAGRRRLAFYVEAVIAKEVSGALALSSLDDLSGTSVVEPGEPTYDPARSGETIVIKLDDPASDGGSKLAGEIIDLQQQIGVKAGIPIAVSGSRNDKYRKRADNFSWPPASETPVRPGAVAQSN